MTHSKTTILWLALIGAFLTVLDTGILYTGTIKLAADLHLSAGALSWVQVAYVLTYAGFMLLAGKLGDIYGRKRFFIAALLIFGLGSLMVGLSTNAPMIISFRAFQGIGSAILQPTCLALLTDTFEGEELQKAIGYYAAVIGAGAAVGIVFGGFCAAFVSWRAGFLVNVPLALIMAFLAMRSLENREVHRGKLDILGTILSVLAMTSLSYGIAGSPWPVPTLVLSAVIWLIFILSQARVSQPMMPLVIFRDRERFGAYVGSLLFSAAGVIFWFYLPQFMQSQLHYSAFIAALGMAPMSLLLFVVALQARKLVRTFGNSLVMIVGLALVLISALGLMGLAKTTSYWVLLPFTLTFGAGFALALAPLTASSIVRIAPDTTGAASGVYNTTRQFGAALGLSLGLAATAGLLHMTGIFQKVMGLASGLVVVGIVFVAILVLPAEKRR